MHHEIMMAIFSGEQDKFDALVEQQSVDVTAVTEPDQWTFLHRALVSVTGTTSAAMIRHLISRGVPVNATDRYGNTPLHYAARTDHVEAMQALLDAGAEVDPVNEEGITPLRQLFLKQPFNVDAIDLLLSRGANMHQSSKEGVSVKEYARIVAHDDQRLLDLFEKYDSG
jgi:ankyrin repeat protein